MNDKDTKFTAKHQSESAWREKVKDFECRRCQACCRQPGFVYLKNGEAETMAQFLNMNLYDFTDTYCEVLNRSQLVLRKFPDEACIFLVESGCRVHSVKPRQCRDFPTAWYTPRSLEYCAGLKVLNISF